MPYDTAGILLLHTDAVWSELGYELGQPGNGCAGRKQFSSSGLGILKIGVENRKGAIHETSTRLEDLFCPMIEAKNSIHILR